MKTIRSIIGGLFVAVMALGAGSIARADEPTVPTPAKTAPAKVGKKFTPEELVETLENMGFQTKTYNDKDGVVTEIGLEIQQGGWTFRPSIVWTKDLSKFILVTTVVYKEGKEPISPEVLKEMLVQNGYIFPASMYFGENPNGSTYVRMVLEFNNEALTPSAIRTKVQNFCDLIKLVVQARDKADKAAAEAKAKTQAKADPNPLVP